MGEEQATYNKLSEDAVADRLLSANKVLILFHVHPDGDAIGSAFALRSFLHYLGKEAFCICADEVPERLRFAMEGQESVLREALPVSFLQDLIVTVDTASPSQLGTLYDIYKDRIDVMIDHHGKGTPYADCCIDPNASACGEVIYRIFKKMSAVCGIRELPLNVKRLVYTAISSDTGCFRYANATSESHKIASRLIGDGVDTADINHRLFGIKTLKQMQVEHAGFERMNFHLDGRVAIITFPYDLKNQYGAADEELETLIDVARCVKGVQVAAVIKQPTPENRFRVSMRSSCDFDVSEICALYGGGGHLRAAGCTVTSDSILSAEMTIVVAIEQRM